MRRVLVMAALLTLTACGAREALKLPPGKPMPVQAYAASGPSNSTQLLTPPVQTRPARSDDLIESTDQRRSDEFDLPPPN